MKEYEVEVVETLIRIVTVKATSEEEAIEVVHNTYMSLVPGEEIILDSDDFFDVDFNVVNNDTRI
jgi:hypothetical protein